MAEDYGLHTQEDLMGYRNRPWLWKVPEEAKVVGKSRVRRLDGIEKASGRAIERFDQGCAEGALIWQAVRKEILRRVT